MVLSLHGCVQFTRYKVENESHLSQLTMLFLFVYLVCALINVVKCYLYTVLNGDLVWYTNCKMVSRKRSKKQHKKPTLTKGAAIFLSLCVVGVADSL